MMLQKNSQGQLVKKLQQKLSEIGYNIGSVDGIFGPRTEAAVLKYQIDKTLHADGIVGDQTWNSLFQEPIPKIPSLDYPPSQARCFEVYGNHQLAGWDEQNMVRCDLSAFADKLGHVYWDWLTPKDFAFIHKDWFGFTCHRLVAPKFQLAFKNVVDRNLADRIKTFGGCLNKRSMRGGNTWSMHSWGIAIDLNAQWNKFGQKNFEMSEDLARCFEDIKFVWGGRWIGSFDAMHFQYATIR